MPETLHISKNSSKTDKYFDLLPQIKALIADEPNLIANTSNISAALKETFGFLWVGFYFVDTKNNQELVLGPFQVCLIKTF